MLSYWHIDGRWAEYEGEEMTDDQSSYDTKRLITVAVIAILCLVGISLFLEPRPIAVQDLDTAQDSKQRPNDDSSEEESAPADTSADQKNRYSYTAAPGDSYTLLARQAVAALGADLSAAQRVAAETKIAQDAGSPSLEIGQVVEFDEAKLRAAIDWASTVVGADEAAWQAYVDLVILPEIK